MYKTRLISIFLPIITILLSQHAKTRAETITFATDHVLKLGSTLDMSCTKDPDTNIVWDVESTGATIAIDGVLQGDQPYELLVDADTQILTIKNISLLNNEAYRCSSLFQNDYIKFNVTVIVPPEGIFIIQPPANEGDIIFPRCVSLASKPPPQMSIKLIYPDGTEEVPDVTISDSVLANHTTTRSGFITMTANLAMNGVRLVCDVSIPELEYEESKSENLYLNVAPVTPYLVGLDPDVPVYAGSYHRIQCVANNGRPAATIKWKWDLNPVNGVETIVDNGNGTFNVISTIEIVNVKSTNDGNRFDCQVVNDAMQSPQVLIGFLQVYHPPVIEVSWDATDESGILFEGATVNFQCSMLSKPEATSSGWVRNNREVKQDDTHAIQNDIYTPNMQIKSLSSEDKGSYQCFGTNAVGTSYSEELVLQILHKPICKRYQIQKYAVKVGYSVDIECHVEANPNTDVIFGWSTNTTQWILKNGQAYEEDPNFASDTFVYEVSSDSDYGPINCKAANGMGSMLSPCVLEIVPPGPAEAPVGCEASNIGFDFIEIECHEVFQGGSPVTYVLQLAKDNYIFAPKVNRTTPKFKLIGLMPITSYRLRVCAANRDFWFSTNCGEQFDITTMNGTINIVPASNPSIASAYAPYIAAGSVLVVLVIGLVVAGVFIKVIKDKENREHQESGEGSDEDNSSTTSVKSYITESNVDAERKSNAAESNSVVLDLAGAAIYSEVRKKRSSHSGSESNGSDKSGHDNKAFDSDEEHIYDQADGLKGVLSQSTIDAIRKEGEHVHKESGNQSDASANSE